MDIETGKVVITKKIEEAGAWIKANKQGIIAGFFTGLIVAMIIGAL